MQNVPPSGSMFMNLAEARVTKPPSILSFHWSLLRTVFHSKKSRVGFVSIVILVYGIKKLKKLGRELDDPKGFQKVFDKYEQPHNKESTSKHFLLKLYYFLRIAIPSPACREARIISTYCAFLVLRTLMSIWISSINGQVVRSIVSMNIHGFGRNLLRLGLFSIPASCVNSLIEYLGAELSTQMRLRMTYHFLNKYFHKYHIYRLSRIDIRIENPELRITEDIENWCLNVSLLFSNLTKPLIDIVWFSQRLASSIGYTGPLGIVLWYTFSALFVKNFSPSFDKLLSEEQMLEGEYKALHTIVVAKAEEISFYGGQKFEKRKVFHSFINIIKHTRKVLLEKLYSGVMESFMIKYCSVMLGYALVGLPLFFSSRVKYVVNGSLDSSKLTEDYVRNSSLLISLSKSIARLIVSYKEILTVKGCTDLLFQFSTVLNDMDAGSYVAIVADEEGEEKREESRMDRRGEDRGDGEVANLFGRSERDKKGDKEGQYRIVAVDKGHTTYGYLTVIENEEEEEKKEKMEENKEEYDEFEEDHLYMQRVQSLLAFDSFHGKKCFYKRLREKIRNLFFFYQKGKKMAPVLDLDSIGFSATCSSLTSSSTASPKKGDATGNPSSVSSLSSNSSLSSPKRQIIKEGNDIVFDGVSIITPTNTMLISNISFRIKCHMHVFVLGSNGCGKSSLFRVLAGLWPHREGRIYKPKGKLFYLPQQAYVFEGSLRDQIIYPDIISPTLSSSVVSSPSHSSTDGFLTSAGPPVSSLIPTNASPLPSIPPTSPYLSAESSERGKVSTTHYSCDKRIRELLQQMQLTHLLERHNDDLSEVNDWNNVLSGGEKQRIAICRLLYHQPLFAILDECTSAVSVDMERTIYELIKQNKITMLSISHRLSLLKYHTHILRIGNNGDWRLESLSGPALIQDTETRQEKTAGLLHVDEKREGRHEKVKSGEERRDEGEEKREEKREEEKREEKGDEEKRELRKGEYKGERRRKKKFGNVLSELIGDTVDDDEEQDRLLNAERNNNENVMLQNTHLSFIRQNTSPSLVLLGQTSPTASPSSLPIHVPVPLPVVATAGNSAAGGDTPALHLSSASNEHSLGTFVPTAATGGSRYHRRNFSYQDFRPSFVTPHLMNVGITGAAGTTGVTGALGGGSPTTITISPSPITQGALNSISPADFSRKRNDSYSTFLMLNDLTQPIGAIAQSLKRSHTEKENPNQ